MLVAQEYNIIAAIEIVNFKNMGNQQELQEDCRDSLLILSTYSCAQCNISAGRTLRYPMSIHAHIRSKSVQVRTTSYR